MKISFTIESSLVFESVKTETYLKGSIDDATNQNASKLKFTETAGDIEVHTRKLAKDYTHGVARLKSIFVDFFNLDYGMDGDDMINVKYDGNDIPSDAVISLTLPRRFSGIPANALANYSTQYVEEYMIYQWWLSTTNMKQAEPYAASMQDLENRIRKCFVITAPATGEIDYEEISAITTIDESETKAGY